MTLTADNIHTYSKDIAELNILLEGEVQTSNALIELDMQLAVSDFNGIAPITSYLVENFPNDAILLYGTLHHMANNEAERQLRNQVSFSAQGLQASIDDKQPAYSNLAVHYKAMFDEKAKEFKKYLNMDAAWGENYSPYTGINDHNFRS